MDKNKKVDAIPVEVEFSDGYQERFTAAVMKIYEKRLQRGESIRIEKSEKSA